MAAALRHQGVILQPSFLLAPHPATEVRVMVDYLVQADMVPRWPA
jgi:hypothetical protein